jgi:NADH:ubiquinone oxidoreductase subunit C
MAFSLVFTQLFKGWLKDGSMVMVNLVKLKQKSLTKVSDENLKVLPYLRHRHLVSVLGHCAITYEDQPKMTSTIFIVFEHILNMSLRIHLTGNKHSHKYLCVALEIVMIKVKHFNDLTTMID